MPLFRDNFARTGTVYGPADTVCWFSGVGVFWFKAVVESCVVLVKIDRCASKRQVITPFGDVVQMRVSLCLRSLRLLCRVWASSGVGCEHFSLKCSSVGEATRFWAAIIRHSGEEVLTSLQLLALKNPTWKVHMRPFQRRSLTNPGYERRVSHCVGKPCDCVCFDQLTVCDIVCFVSRLCRGS